MGDSISDEYRADDHRGGAYASTTFNWVELLVQEGYDFGPWGTRNDSRRTGYEYNWALSGARVADIIQLGQHTGLAGQVVAGKVKNVVLQIGANDFAVWNGTYDEVYASMLTDQEVTAKVNEMVGGIATAADTVRAAGPVNMVIANVADRGNTPRFLTLYPDASKRQRVTDAIMAVNQGIAAMAGSRNIPVVDLYGAGVAMLSRFDANGNYYIAGEPITFATDGNEPHHAMLADSEHAGTVFSGIMANLMFLDPFARFFGLPLLPISETEMLLNAAIVPPAPLTEFAAYPTTITLGGSAALHWNATHATAASIDNGIGPLTTAGSLAVSPEATTTYTLTTLNGSSTVDRKKVTVTVSALPLDTTPPAVAVTVPQEGQVVAGTLPCSAQASDDVGVTRVEFFANGKIVSSGVSFPYGVFWDTKKVPDGAYAITARAYDAAGNSTLSAPVHVTVRNSQPSTFHPDAYAVASGTYLSGSIADLVSNDGRCLVIQSTSSGSARSSETRLTISGIQTFTPRRIAIQVRASSSASNTTFLLQAYDVVTQRWVTLDTTRIGAGEVSRTGTITVTPARFVSPTRQLLARIQTTRGSATYKVSYDLAQVTITP